LESDILKRPDEISLQILSSKLKYNYLCNSDTNVFIGAPGTFFYEVRRSGADPNVFMLRKHVFALKKQLNQVEQKLNEVSKKMKANKREEKVLKPKDEEQLKTHAKNEIRRLTLKIEKAVAQQELAVKEEQILSEDLRVLVQKLEEFKAETEGKYKGKKTAVSSTLNENELMRSEKERALLVKSAEIEALKKKKELLEKWRTLHTNFLNTLMRNSKKRYLATKQTDMEHLLDTYYLHHKHVQNSGFFERKYKSVPEGGARFLIEKANKDLEALKKWPPVLSLEEGDPRSKAFGLLWELIKDNINMRMSMNNNIEALLTQNKRKLDEIVKIQDTPKEYADAELKRNCITPWKEKPEQLEKFMVIRKDMVLDTIRKIKGISERNQHIQNEWMGLEIDDEQEESIGNRRKLSDLHERIDSKDGSRDEEEQYSANLSMQSKAESEESSRLGYGSILPNLL